MKKNGFKVTASIEGQSWESSATLLTASSIEDARAKGALILRTRPEHKIEVEPIEVFSTDEKIEVDNYPYGSMRTTAFFSVESVKNKGYRSIFQTINPKNGRLNAEKKSTYSHLILQYKNSIGHVNSFHFSAFDNDSKGINKIIQILNDFFDILTTAEIEDLTLNLIATHKANTIALVHYKKLNFEEIKPIIDNSVKTLTLIAKTKENLFSQCLLDVDALEALKPVDDKPVFQVTKAVLS